MKKSVFSMFLIVIALSACLLLSLNAAGGEIIVSAQVDGGNLSSLEAGDIVRVTVVLPKVENTNKLQFDLIFNASVFEYNGDADANGVLSQLSIGKVEAVGDDTIRLVAAGLSNVSFSSETAALTASFTVKQDASTGKYDAFSLAGFKCADVSVSIMTNYVTVEIVNAESPESTTLAETTEPPEETTAAETTLPSEETTVAETTLPSEETTVAETTSAPKVTTSVVTTAPPKVTIAVETTSKPAVTTVETSKPVESDKVEDSSTEVSESPTDISVPDTDAPDAIETTIKADESTYANDTKENEKVTEDSLPIVVPVVVVLLAACTIAVVVAFLWSKRMNLPK